MEQIIRVFGHNNIRAMHKSTWQITKEDYLTPKGDCIIGIRSTHGAIDLDQEIKAWLKDGKWIEIRIIVDDVELVGEGMGHEELTFNDNIDMVFRKSDFICDRTITIKTTFSASDLPEKFREKLIDPDQACLVKLRPITKV